MKRILIKRIVRSMLLTGCLAAFAPLTVVYAGGGAQMPSLPSSVVPKENESEVVVRYMSSNKRAKGSVRVFIDGELRATVRAESSERMIVPDGEHTIMVQNGANAKRSATSRFDVERNRIVFKVARISGSHIGLNQDAKTDLGESAGQQATAAAKPKPKTSAPARSNSLEEAVTAAAERLINALPERGTVAVISVSTRNRQEGTYVITELEYMLVNSAWNDFKIVDRRSLEFLRSEQSSRHQGRWTMTARFPWASCWELPLSSPARSASSRRRAPFLSKRWT
ncbi:MAG: hypothetical protein LBD24_01595 [Spirochaetaceae bacterium]|jgi:hypothetical protein|nr:hypothetical protein [Spirochaetaceae bacterium]